ncbi:MAG: GTP-dependent dephospho-CoA kinase family protein [Methanoregula sp.]|nr:GTP-dependent dephospho-CoA kinase family protein [Methanoregula sp.]
MLTLPEEHRKVFQEPFGELHRNLDEIIWKISAGPIYAVGDVVTYNLQKRGITPAIAVVDGLTMRSPCKRMPAVHGESIRVKNPPGTLTNELIRALEHAVGHPPVTVIVDGEEDLAVIPLVIAAPEGAMILYGQPHRGVVLRVVDHEAKKTARDFLSRFIHSDA